MIEDCYTEESGLKPSAALVEHCCDWKRFLTGDGDFEDPDTDLTEEDLFGDNNQEQHHQQQFNDTPLFTDIHNTSYHHQFKIFKHPESGKVVVQARPHAEPRKHWEPEEGIEVLSRLPDEEAPFILQPKPLKDDDCNALFAVRSTFEDTGHTAYLDRPDVRQYWKDQEEYQQGLRENGLKGAHEAPQDFYKVLVPYHSYGK